MIPICFVFVFQYTYMHVLYTHTHTRSKYIEAIQMVTYGRRTPLDPRSCSALLRQTNSLKCKHIYMRTKLPILLQLYSFNIRVCVCSVNIVCFIMRTRECNGKSVARA